MIYFIYNKFKFYFIYNIFNAFLLRFLMSFIFVKSLVNCLRRPQNSFSFSSFLIFLAFPAGKYWSPGRPEDAPSNVPRTFPKNPIWPSQERPQLARRGRLEMTSWGRPNLTSKGSPWEVVSGSPHDVLRTSPSRPWKHVLGMMWAHLLDLSNFLFTFLSELNQLTKSI